jgi:membrane-bound lytic murein transglycosylase F
MQVVYRHGEDKPKGLAALSGHLTLASDSALVEWLHRSHPGIVFNVAGNANTEELMARVAHGDLDATIANADLVAMNQRYYPALRVAFTVPGARQRLAWAFDRAGLSEDGLYNKAIAFIEQSRHDGIVRILRDRYFSHAAQLGFVGGAEFARQVKKRLRRWRSDFKRSARKTGLNWRLLAAIGYQESRWEADAVSPTDVRGLMMLTQVTAAEIGIDDRRDPQQSIDGGARYLRALRRRLPATIHEPDRTWFALAAYNIGLGHVMDARRLLAARDKNPNLWINLRVALGWLSQQRYLNQTQYGYAKGLQAVAYVDDIRAYYAILTWMSDKKHRRKPAALDREASADAESERTSPPAIAIDTPAF